ncbi:MAG: GH1 family beta-glucosidase [Actinomycetota bacterium]|nr:GH1 family beta-glucosidase [Actinomycetota bacterium]
MTDLELGNFGRDFFWGTATASYQIEGAVSEGGRGTSIWDTFSHSDGKVTNGDTGDIACDHYHRLEEDLDLLGQLGVSTYRFSLAWPRIQPDGSGKPNQGGIDFYARLIDGLLERNIEPVPTIYHWDLPQSLQDKGGWKMRETSYRFADYAGVVTDAFKDRVKHWITLNEPWCSAWLGYAVGVHAPGETNIDSAVAATHHLLLGHGLALQQMRSMTEAKIGITLNLSVVRPASQDRADIEVARLVDGNLNRIFLDPIFKKQYPGDLVSHYGGAIADATTEDLETIGQGIDFLGVNFYFPSIVIARQNIDKARSQGLYVDTSREPNLIDADFGSAGVHRMGVKRTAMDWEIEAGALTELLVRVHDEYSTLPIMITENGCATHDYVNPSGKVIDDDRIEYIESHIAALASAIEKGVDVAGYFVWSLLDNFEWAYGYSRRFGIVWVDYETQRRIPKKSFYRYKEIIKAARDA